MPPYASIQLNAPRCPVMTAGGTDSDWSAIWDLFHEARALDESARDEFLDRSCATNAVLRQKLEDLLAAHDSADDGWLPDVESLLDAGDTAALFDEPVPGTLLGPYEIEMPIGAGGMGTVYRARQQEPVERTVALKLLQFGVATRNIVARFNAERQALAMMSHSNIAKVFDAGATEAGRPYFVMEYVPGMPITEYCDTRKLDIDARLRLFLKACDGVLHAHQKGIIHRDIKPSNVLVCEENGLPVPKIIDFGIAKAAENPLGEQSLHTRVGTLIGTPGYMSPEQAGVVPLDVDIRADVYSLGVLLYQLLVGLSPFEATTSAVGLLEVQEAIRDEEPQRPSQRLSGESENTQSEISANRTTRPQILARRLQSDIEWIMLKAIDKNRDMRYPSVAEMAADIGRFLHGMPVTARAPTKRYRIAKFVQRHTAGVVVGAAIAVLIIGFASAMTVQSFRLQRALDETTLEKNRAEQVAEFMVDLFEGANPEVAGRNDVTASEILEQGSNRLKTELTGQPELRARLLATVGEAYRVLGGADNATTAVTLLEQAMQDLTTAGATNEQRAAVFNTLGTVHHDAGDLDRAENAYRQALDLAGAAPDSRLRADVLGNLGVLLTDRGNLSEAEDRARESLAIMLRVGGPRDPTVARLKQRIAYMLHQRGESAAAQEMILDSLDVIRETSGQSHPAVATALNYAAIIQGGAGDYVAAQQSLLEAIDIYRQTQGDDHPYLATTLSNLAMQYNRARQFDEAVEALAEALRVGTAAHGPDHPNVNTYRINLGTTLQDMGRLREAEPLLQEGLVQDRRTLAAGSPYLLATLDRLGATLHRLGRVDEAEPLLREAAESRRENPGEHDAETGAAILNLALARLSQGFLDDAERLAQESLDIQRSLADASDPLAQSLAGLASVRYAQERTGEARRLLLEAVAMFGPATERTVISVGQAGRLLGRIEAEGGEVDAALEAYARAERSLLEQLPESHPDVVETRIAQAVLRCRAAGDNANADAIRPYRPPLERAFGPDNGQLEVIDTAVEECLAYRDASSL